MKRSGPALICALLALATGLPALRAQEETVTIPKSRLEELERKAAELDRLKDAAAKQADAAKKPAESSPQSPPAPTIPSLQSLPPLKAGEPVSALDLLAHYAADPVAAAARYGKQRITVAGEIIGFDKPLFTQRYEVLLKTGDPARRVVCNLEAPSHYRSTYPAQSGTVLVGITPRGEEVTLLRVGQSVVVEGRCSGLHGGNVSLGWCVLKSAR